MSIELYRNGRGAAPSLYTAAHRNALDPVDCARVRDALRAWPVYGRTPLHSLSGLARMLGIGALYAKDESRREPLRSFKGLGGAYALAEALRAYLELRLPGVAVSHDSLWRGDHRDLARDFAVCAVTDGNHGRSLAWAARAFGTPCRIYVPRAVSAERRRLIAEFGATILEVDGNYEAALAVADGEAHRHGWALIQDTSFPGYTVHCQRIMQGYTLLSAEAREQLPPGEIPTHVFVQVGCGGLAAAVVADMVHAYGERRPAFVAVQSREADCLYRSLQAGERVEVGGAHATMMIGIAVGEVSMLAWDLLRDHTDFAARIDDGIAARTMRLLARGESGDPRLEIGETGVAGLAALIAAAEQPAAREALGLDARSRVLVIFTEAALDVATFERVLAADAAA